VGGESLQIGEGGYPHGPNVLPGVETNWLVTPGRFDDYLIDDPHRSGHDIGTANGGAHAIADEVFGVETRYAALITDIGVAELMAISTGSALIISQVLGRGSTGERAEESLLTEEGTTDDARHENWGGNSEAEEEN